MTCAPRPDGGGDGFEAGRYRAQKDAIERRTAAPPHAAAHLPNIPDGEVYTAPVRESMNGTIAYNTPSLEDGFTYENIGYIDKPEGLRFWLHFDAAISDSDGEIGDCYAENDHKIPNTAVPDQLPVGSHCTVTEAIGVNHKGDLTLTVNKQGNNRDHHVAVFYLPIVQ